MRYPIVAAGILLLACSSAAAQSATDAPLLRPTNYDLEIELDLQRERMDARSRIRLRNETRDPVATASLLLYRLLNVSAVRDSAGAPLPFQQRVIAFEDFGKLQVNHVLIPLVPALAPGKEITLQVEYGGHILGYAETGRLYVRDRIDTAYALLRMDTYAYPQPGYASLAADRRAGLPEFEYTARITVPTTHSVANGGALVERRETGATTAYVYRSLKPSWRMDFAVARFDTLRDGDLVVHHLPADSLGASRVLNAMSRTLTLYTRWFGPLRGSSSFAVIELPDGWGSQADATSVLQSAAAFGDPRRESELYHEISHLWNGTTEWPSPRWDEGLATFLEDVTADSLSGTATTDSSAMRMARWLAGRLAQDSALRDVPMVDYGKRQMTGYSYWVGSLMFYGLYRLVGHDVFGDILRDYYQRYQASGGSSANFVRVANNLSPIDLTAFFDDWLFSTRWGIAVSGAQQPAALYERHKRSASNGSER